MKVLQKIKNILKKLIICSSKIDDINDEVRDNMEDILKTLDNKNDK